MALISSTQSGSVTTKGVIKEGANSKEDTPINRAAKASILRMYIILTNDKRKNSLRELSTLCSYRSNTTSTSSNKIKGL